MTENNSSCKWMFFFNDHLWKNVRLCFGNAVLYNIYFHLISKFVNEHTVELYRFASMKWSYIL